MGNITLDFDEHVARRLREWTLPFRPMMGGAPEGDPDPAPDPPKPDPDPAPDPDPKKTEPDPDPDPPEDGDSEKARLRAENRRLMREKAEREKAMRIAERKAKEAADARAAEQGEWKKLAEERADRISELESAIQERDRRDVERDQRTRVQTVAEELNFRRPRRAFAVLMDELGSDEAAETLADEELTRAALKRLAKAEPELVDNQRRSGAPVNGTTAGQTPDQEMASFLKGLVGIPTD
jgi:colicin import membrane protein